MQKLLRSLPFLLLALAPVVRGAEPVATTDSSSGLYARVAVAYGFFGDFKDVAGPDAAIGNKFGAGRHAIEIEAATFSSKVTGYFGNTVKFTPILLNYRYSFPSAKTGLGAYVGGSVGAMRQQGSFRYFGNITDTVFAGGGGGGLTYAWGKNASADLGLKVLGVDRSDIATRGRVSILSLGVNFQF